jgi:DNA-directed RNA polymerase specialized sigma subunit
MNSDNGETKDVEQSSELKEVAQNEHEYLHERLRAELGREPTEEELDEWLRQHTEGY